MPSGCTQPPTSCPRTRGSTSIRTRSAGSAWSTATPTGSASRASIRSSSTGWRCRSSRPIPVEADRFYAQPGMAQRNLSFDWYPVGSGPYMLTVNNPNRHMVLERNPNFPAEPYPSRGRARATRRPACWPMPGNRMPFIDRVVFSLEKESIPYWNKFLQGYYDASGITLGHLRSGGPVTGSGDAQLTPSNAGAGHPAADLGGHLASCTWASTCSTRWWAGTPSARASCARPSRSPSTRKSSSPSSSTGAASPRRAPIPPGIFGYRERRGGHQPLRVRLGGRRAAPQVDRGRQAAAGRGRLSRRHRPRERQAAHDLFRQHHERASGAKARTRLADASSSTGSTCSW